MVRVKIPLPKISMEEVEKLLDACVRPTSQDPSLLEIQLEHVPPLLLPPTLRAFEGTSRRKPSGPLQIRLSEWGNFSAYLWTIAMEYVDTAGSMALADRGPSAADLEQAPLVDPWVPGQDSSGDYCLFGFGPSARDRKRSKPVRYRLTAIDVGRGWALCYMDWFRLGRRISGREFQELAPKFTNLQESSDEEVVYKMLANRANVAWRLSQLRLPQG